MVQAVSARLMERRSRLLPGFILPPFRMNVMGCRSMRERAALYKNPLSEKLVARATRFLNVVGREAQWLTPVSWPGRSVIW
jgi:hypothetical protein